MNDTHWSATVRKLYRQRWRIWIVVSLAHTVSLFHRAAMAPITDRVMADFDITALAFGSLGAAYFYTYAAMQLPSGTLADTLGPRKTVTAGLFLAAAGSIYREARVELWSLRCMAQRCQIGHGMVLHTGVRYHDRSNWCHSKLWAASCHHSFSPLGNMDKLANVTGDNRAADPCPGNCELVYR